MNSGHVKISRKDGIQFCSYDYRLKGASIYDVDDFLGMHDETLLKEVLKSGLYDAEAQELQRLCWNRQARGFFYEIELNDDIAQYLDNVLIKPHAEDYE